MPEPREPMRTYGGLSVRAEIEARLEAARQDARSAAFEEAIAFLRASGQAEAATMLNAAAFMPQKDA